MKASAWVILEPQYFRGGTLRGFRMNRLTQGRPATLSNGERSFRLEIEVPTTIFDPFADVKVTVPEGDIIEPEITVGER